MAGGTQVTQTTTEPWLEQQQYLQRGFGRAEDAYLGGQFSPAAYGMPGTMSPWVEALQGTPAMVAPGLAGFDPQQQEAMQGMYGYAMGNRPAAMQSAAEQAMLGGEADVAAIQALYGAPGAMPYSQAAMGIGLGSAGFGGGPTGPFVY